MQYRLLYFLECVQLPSERTTPVIVDFVTIHLLISKRLQDHVLYLARFQVASQLV